MEPNYRLVFNLADQPFRLDPSFIVPLVLTGVGALLVFKPDLMQRLLPRGPKGTARKIFSWFYFLFSAFMTVTFLVSTVGESNRLRAAQKSGAVAVTQGCLQAFHPMPVSGHDTERLKINGQTFAYSDYIITRAFHQTESHGGPVHADSKLKVSHVDGDIVRLEVADHACPTAPDIPNP